ncbi:MAG: arginine--tRNA ligase, partial [Chlamydiae bacterium]|nr:arginine--tRNA ligase [Chlamydiota bacterium]
MEMLSSFLQRAVSTAIGSLFELSSEETKAEISPCAQEQFGHYQCNSALRLAKTLGQNPREIAERIIEKLDRSAFANIAIAGPGFINFTFSPEFLSKELQKQLKDPLIGASAFSPKQRVIVEFSSPNVAKELHVGHIRSTIIGDCLARLFEFLKQDVLRLNHIGDWGTQFGMLITYMKEAAPNVLNGKEATTLEALMQWYRASKKRFDEDPDFKKRAQLEVVSLQGGDKEALHAWKLICDISRKAFQEIYNLLDVKIEERGESFYNP